MNAIVRTKPARWLIMLAVLALLAAACGDDTGDTAEEDPGEPDPADEEPADDPDDPEDDPEDDGDEDPGDDEDEGDEDEGDDEGDPDGEEEADVDDIDTEGAEGPADEGDLVLYGDEQEPTVLNPFVIDGNATATSQIVNNVLAGANRVNPELETEPHILAEAAEVVSEDPFQVNFTIRDDAEWSDGTPITTEDFIFHTEVYQDEENADQLTSTAGYELITEWEEDGDKSVTFTFEEPYPAYDLMFSNLMPAHALADQEFATAFADDIADADGNPIGSGPFLLDSWDQGTQVRLVANENYFGDGPDVEEIVFRFVPDTTTLTQQFVGGEISMFAPQPQLDLVEAIDSVDGAELQVEAGVSWEHIDFNHLVDGLDQPHVRQAIALGIDRETIVDTLIRPTQPEAEVLQNIHFIPQQEGYEADFGQWDFDPDAAVALLEENGCERNDSDIFECDGVELSFRIGTTGGNERRELTQQLIQSDLAQIGIDIQIENTEGSAFFDLLNTPENCDGVCDYDIALFAWVGTPDFTSSANIYGCEKPQNWTVSCNEEATELMDQARVTPDEDERIGLMADSHVMLADDVPIVPLFQQETFVAHPESLQNVQVNTSTASVFWNSNEWTYQ